MARAQWGDEDGTGAEAGAEPGAGAGPHTSAPDARLTALIRADTATAYPALRELRLRHRPAVLAYARLCAVDESGARQLTAQAFALAARETAGGVEPRGPWRHQLLLMVTRVAAAWATDDRGDRLDPGLLVHLGETGADGPVPPMLTAFHSLPTRVQGLVWYGVVDEQPDATAAVYLGFTPQDVTYGKESAFQALRQACLKARLARSGNPSCQDFRRLIEEAVRPDHPRYGMDLDAHMALCAHCAAAYEEQCALRDTPRAALAEGLLAWGGAAYATDGSGTPGDASRLSRTARHSRTTAAAAWLPSRRFALASAALGVAVAPLLVYLLSPNGSEPQRAANSVTTPQPPAVTVTATVSATSSPSPTRTTKSPEPTRTSKPPKPSKTARPSPTPERPPAPHPPNSAYAQVVNAESGLCLDIDGDPQNGTDVDAATCTSSRDQRWRVDSGRGVLQSYAYPDYCLDSRGSVGRGVGIWECDSVDGPNGRNLTFTVDGDGVIRPAIAPDHAVTAYGDRLVLLPAQGRDDQRWTAGAAPA
ncbi:ricin-type beta-trefoil lectin domain protein [Streptomyces sp. HC44]|uniref:Ricin-type beta-trefoil lectin domain protein n=1 Tax=Streptomyces scabichelini TaxID=2711217 RepID=A0A6G4VNJ8_9ACTN|nr:ricin-type beta-trefoil lectin domain protein [Streptomyces scabichelini]NGO15541.1 ricin-type beta-trefoil lectin domain protein [Streptomyces scabichelini]